MEKFEKVLNINVSDKTEKKNNLTYLSWAWAWGEFKKIYPDANYEIIKNENNMPYFADATGGIVYTQVTAGGLTYEMWLPIMDYRNRSMKLGEFTSFDVNKTIMRCLTKNLAMFGLGLYIYAGEDLPEEEAEKKTKNKVKEEIKEDDPNANHMAKKIIALAEKLEKQDFENYQMWLFNTFKTDDIYLLDEIQQAKVYVALQKKEEAKKPLIRTI